MSEPIHMAFERFAARFLRPLLCGGEVELGRPLGPGCLDYFAEARASDTDVDGAIYDALHRIASAVAPVQVLPHPDRGTAALAMACHDLAALTDPSWDGVFAREARPAVLDWVDRLIDAVPPPTTRGEALARHALVSRALELRRRDVLVRTWAYTHRFFGRPVPDRVLAMPDLRRVREERTERPLPELWHELDERRGLDTSARLRALVSRSPVTELMRVDVTPDFAFGAASLCVLSDEETRHGIAGVLAGKGLARVAVPLGRALGALVSSRFPAELLACALALAMEVHLIALLDGTGATADGDVLSWLGSPEARLFGAVPIAVLELPAGGSPPWLEVSVVDEHAFGARARSLAAGIDAPALAQARRLVSRAGGKDMARAETGGHPSAARREAHP